MGLFFPSDPIVHGQRAKGLPRYQELLERDWKSFLFADFVTLGLCIPYGLGVGYALLSSSLLVLLPVCILGGLLVGPAISGMMDALFRSYRDAPFWPQVVLFEESNLHRLQNAILFCLKYGKHVIGTAILQLGWWLLFVLFLPWTGFLVPFLGVWFIWFVCFFLLYSDFDAAYGIEEKIRQQFPEQTPRYDE